MKLPRRRFLHLAAGAAALPIVSRNARAQAYPSRPVRLVSPFAPSGQNDLFARLIGQWLSEHFGQQVIVENRSGAIDEPSNLKDDPIQATPLRFNRHLPRAVTTVHRFCFSCIYTIGICRIIHFH